MNKLLMISVVAAMAMPLAQAGPLENHDAMDDGAARLLDVQLESGAMPWMVGQSGEFQNVQGITAMGLLEAYKLTLNGDYLDGATRVQAWLDAYMSADPAAYISSANIYFLAEHAIVSGNLTGMELARDATDRAIERFGDAEGLVDAILNARAGRYGNMGVWDVALFIRAAQEIGDTQLADDLSAALLDTTVVDLFDATTNYYELGLSGLLFGLSESDLLGHQETLAQARTALLETQCDNGSFPATWEGDVSCDHVQTTAYAIIGLSTVADQVSIQSGCDFLVEAQDEETGGWDLGGYETAEIDAEATGALAACLVPANNGAASYLDAARSML